MNDYVNIVLIVGFGILSVLMFYRYFKNGSKVMIKDQQWSYIRILFLVIGVLSVISLVSSANNSVLDYFRIGVMIVAVTSYMLMRDGVGEEGMVAGGRFYSWDIVRAYDWQEKKSTVAVFFTLDDPTDKKPDGYTTKELDFAKDDKDVLLEFLKLNLGRKYTRMKKKY
ncbi:MAG: hypothetical protein K6G61_10810 [Solobacterium sp.]|nr:hypothetical protein [Solobacterium sp.]